MDIITLNIFIIRNLIRDALALFQMLNDKTML